MASAARSAAALQQVDSSSGVKSRQRGCRRAARRSRALDEQRHAEQRLEPFSRRSGLRMSAWSTSGSGPGRARPRPGRRSRGPRGSAPRARPPPRAPWPRARPASGRPPRAAASRRCPPPGCRARARAARPAAASSGRCGERGVGDLLEVAELAATRLAAMLPTGGQAIGASGLKRQPVLERALDRGVERVQPEQRERLGRAEAPAGQRVGRRGGPSTQCSSASSCRLRARRDRAPSRSATICWPERQVAEQPRPRRSARCRPRARTRASCRRRAGAPRPAAGRS